MRNSNKRAQPAGSHQPIFLIHHKALLTVAERHPSSQTPTATHRDPTNMVSSKWFVLLPVVKVAPKKLNSTSRQAACILAKCQRTFLSCLSFSGAFVARLSLPVYVCQLLTHGPVFSLQAGLHKAFGLLCLLFVGVQAGTAGHAFIKGCSNLRGGATQQMGHHALWLGMSPLMLKSP